MTKVQSIDGLIFRAQLSIGWFELKIPRISKQTIDKKISKIAFKQNLPAKVWKWLTAFRNAFIIAPVCDTFIAI